LAAVVCGAYGAGVDDLPYNRVQFKAAHNSIDRDETLYQQLEWDEGKTFQAGCRGVELDIVADPERLRAEDAWRFAVQHGGDYDPNNPTLRECLAEIKKWSTDHPGHGVITIHVDLKDGACQGVAKVFADKIDEIFGSQLGADSIFKPSQLQRDAANLLEGARKYGWPKLKDLMGRFILCFSGEDSSEIVLDHKKTYATTDAHKRLAFVDADMRHAYITGTDAGYIENEYYQEGWRVFINLQRGRPGWLLLGKRAQEVGGFVTRVWKCNTEESWEDAVSAGINVISTDRLRDHPWARVGKEPYRAVRGH
jgi:hypothetical protein